MDSDKSLRLRLGAAFAGIAALVWNVPADTILQYASEAFSHQVTQFVFAFSIAAWIHSGRMKKEFKSLTLAVNDLGSALRADLGALNSRIGVVEKTVVSITERLNKP